MRGLLPAQCSVNLESARSASIKNSYADWIVWFADFKGCCKARLKAQLSADRDVSSYHHIKLCPKAQSPKRIGPENCIVISVRSKSMFRLAVTLLFSSNLHQHWLTPRTMRPTSANTIGHINPTVWSGTVWRLESICRVWFPSTSWRSRTLSPIAR